MASTVLANVAGSGLVATASHSARCCSRPSVIAGRKCSVRICASGGSW